MRCEKCNSSLFHIEKVGSLYVLKCWKEKLCGWSISAEVSA